MNDKVLYVSLDERNCNYGFPWELGRDAGLDVRRPPMDLMSRAKVPADVDALWNWVDEHGVGCTYAALSLDMLVYGCLIHSRRHTMSEEECIGRLNRLIEVKRRNPTLEIHAFNLIMRTPNYDNSSEEPDYWADYGKRIWRFSFLTSKGEKSALGAGEADELEGLRKAIPLEILEDVARRRSVNLAVNLAALQLVKEGVIDLLVIPKDDNSEFGFSMQDQDVVYKRIIESGIRNRVYIYPGADEVGCTTMCRILNRTRGACPKIHVVYSSTLGGDIIAKYEDRPIHESVKWQALSSGGRMTDDWKDADIVLMVNTPGKYMIECADQYKRDYTYINFRNLDEFVQRMNYYVASGKRCAVADIAYPNGADNELLELMKNDRLLDRVFAYGGWNTAANTLGVVILQATAAIALGVSTIKENQRLYEFHVRKLIEDWAYQANVLNLVAKDFAEEIGFDGYKLGASREIVAREIVARLNDFLAAQLVEAISAKGLRVLNIDFPWDRIYDIRMELEWNSSEST